MKRLSTEPVLTAASLASLIMALVIFLRAMGWISLDDAQFKALEDVIIIALPIVFALWARRLVTPLVRPRDRDGTPLIRAN